jgi:hypothetical protein
MWARGAVMQCCFNQTSIDCLIPVYFGSVDKDAIFDLGLLSGCVVQVKFKGEADTVEMRPLGIPSDLDRPLPYLAILMELGTETLHRTTRSKIKVTPSETPREQYRQLRQDWVDALLCLEDYRKTPSSRKEEIRKLQKDVKEKQQAMDSCNRYIISVRGASSNTYGILDEAGIAEEFGTLLHITMPSPTPQDVSLQHMRPFESIGETFSHTDWMTDFGD